MSILKPSRCAHAHKYLPCVRLTNKPTRACIKTGDGDNGEREEVIQLQPN